MTAPYTTNIAQNPGLQLGLSGYAGLNNATLAETPVETGGTLFGNPGLLVTTPGVVSGEGVITPASTVQTTTAHSASVYIQGTILPSSVTVYVISNPGGVILGSTPVTLTDEYQRVVINNFPATQNNTLSLIISTTMMDETQFWITNIQIEPDTTSHPYCDGGLSGCAWQTSVGGVSFQQYQNTITAISNIVDGSSIVNALIKGEAFNVTVNPGFIFDHSLVVSNTSAVGPIGAMTDFAVFGASDPDPAQTYVSYNNSGISVPTSGYARSFSAFYPPQDYFVSTGQLYKKAAYMAVGWQFSNVPNNAHVTITDVQTEVANINGFGAASPASYKLPRSITTIVKPDRLNYCTNPSMEVDISGWNAVGSATLTQDPATSVGLIIVIDDSSQATGKASLNVTTVNNSGDGTSIPLNNLIAGDTYIASAYVQAGPNVNDITMSCSNSVTSVVHGNSGTGYNTGTYGSGFYGGNPPASTAIATGTWYRIYTTFQPTDSTATLTFTATATAPTNFWVDAVLVEPGAVLGFYFDGNFGTNYFWEAGGTPGLARSYFYDEYFVKSQAVLNVLGHHTPLGISFNTPQYFIPPTQ